MAEWMNTSSAVSTSAAGGPFPLSRRGRRSSAAVALPCGAVLAALCIALCGLASCVRQIEEPATGLVRRPQQIKTLQVTPVSSPRELLGAIDVGVREISRLARRGTVVAMQTGGKIALMDIATAQATVMGEGQAAQLAAADLATLPLLRVGNAGQTIELMYGPTRAGFAVLIDSDTSGLPVPAWLTDDGTIRPIVTGLPPEMGVQCWLPLTDAGDVLLLAAGAAGQKPRLWVSRAGVCVPFAAAGATAMAGEILEGAGATDGYFLLVPSGDGSLIGAVRESGLGVHLDMFDAVQRRRLYSLRLAEYGERGTPVGRSGWGPKRSGTAAAMRRANESGDIPGARGARAIARAIGPVAWSCRGGGDGRGGVDGGGVFGFVPLWSIEDAMIRLYGRQIGAVVRLPAQVGSISEWNERGVVGWGMELGAGLGPGLGAGLRTGSVGQSLIVPGAWAMELDLDEVSSESERQVSGVWSVSDEASFGLGLADGGVLVIQRLSPGMSALFRVRPL